MTAATNTIDQRVHDVRREHLRQELLAPAAALAGWADLVRDDAAARGLQEFLADLDRIRHSAHTLHDWIAGVLAGSTAISPNASRLRHDLRTPLNAVRGFAELILEGGGGRADPLREDLCKVMTEADRILHALGAIVLFPTALEPAVETGAAEAIGDLIGSWETRRAAARETGRILVVDDNDSSRDLLVRRLGSDGHTVFPAATGAEARGVLARETVDLVLLDLVLPDTHGYRLLCRLKLAPATRDIPVLVVTGIDAIPSAVRCIEAGAEDYLRKPVSAVLMRARIDACLERKRWRDRERQVLAELEAEKRRTRTLLNNILPAPVAARLERGEAAVPARVPAVSVLFVDLVGFTTLSARLPAADMVAMLNLIYTEFDALAEGFGVEKIKTLGDCYMAAAGVPEPCADHAERAAALALAMVPAVQRTGDELGLPLAVRIGIHSGPAVAGIIGTRKFSYDLWGDTVNLAARLEKHGMPGRIHVSAATADLLEPHFIISQRSPVAMKGTGPVVTAFLEGRRA